MKRIAIFLALCAGLIIASSPLSASNGRPPLRDGDLIFQTSTGSQSAAILAATAHPFTHMGVIKHRGKQIVVVEAAATVKETPLDIWVARGALHRIAVYRDLSLTEQQIQALLRNMKPYYGQPYDIFFAFDNNALYCSELPYLAYRKLGISIGRVQKIGDLNMNSLPVRTLIAERWQRHAVCKARSYTFEQCHAFIRDQELVTPASIAQDPRFTRIYSNYPF